MNNGTSTLKSYITQQDDVLDLVCWRYYGMASGVVERVLLANPHLAKYPVRLPIGIEITLPVFSIPNKKRLKLWD
jgi:phage tail protein X